MSNTTYAKVIDAVPNVANTSDRDARFPSPDKYQKVYVQSSNSIQQWDGSAWQTIFLGVGTVGNFLFSGTGSPESSVTAPVGSLYIQSDGANGSTLWVKRTGTGNTGWALIATSLGVFNYADYRQGGVVSDQVALQSLLTAVGVSGGEAVFPAGTFTIDGASLTGKSNIVLRGQGRATKFVMSGVTDAAMLTFTQCSNVYIHDIWFHGNNVSSTDGPQGSAIYFDLTGTASDQEGFFVERCIFDNFKGGGWVRVQNPSSFDMTKVRFLENTAFGGSDRAPGTIGVASAMFSCRLGTSSGNIRDVEMSGNICDAYTVKNALHCVQDGSGTGKFYRVRYLGNSIQRAGVSNVATVDGAYAMIIYGGSVSCVVANNTVNGAVQAGLYLNLDTDTVIASNTISDVTSSSDAALPRGGLVVNDSQGVTVTGNSIRDCALGIQVSNGAPSAAYVAVGVTITGNTVTGGSNGIILRNGNGANATGYAVTGNTCAGQTDRGINLRRVATTDSLNNLTVTGNTVVASTSPNSGYRGIGSSLDLYGDRWLIANNTVDCKQAAASVAIQIANATATGVASGRISGNYAYNAVAYGFSFIRTRCNFLDNVADTCGTGGNAATGAFRTALAQGTWWGNRVVNPPASTFVIESGGSEDLGLDTPTWTGNAGAIVQRQTPSKNRGQWWICTGTTTWVESGALITMGADRGDNSITLTVGTDDTYQQYASALTGNKTVTLSTTNAYTGALFRVTRLASATGAFTLTVGGGPVLNPGEWCDHVYSGSAWVHVASGTLAGASGAASFTSAAPTGTTSLTAVMMAAGAATITPVRGTKIMVIASGQMANSTINDGATVDLRFGTGTAPVNGAAVTGTLIGIAQTKTSLVAADRGGFCLSGKVTGLTAGTTYWLDLSLMAVTGGTATVTGVSIAAFEVM